MTGSKLIEIFQTFLARDFRLFGEFVASPFFNKRPELQDFFAVIRSHREEIFAGKFGQEAIWAELFPQKPFDEKEFGYLMSFLLKLAESYLGQQFYRETSGMEPLHILQACNARNLEKHYLHIRKQFQQTLKPGEQPSQHFYYQRYLLAEIGAEHFHKTNLRTFDQNLQEAVDHLDHFYLTQKLKLSCELINRRQILSVPYDLRLVDELMAYLDLYPYNEIPPVAVYRQVLLILSDSENAEHFWRLKSLMVKYQSHFPALEFREISFYAQNYCIKRIKQGHPEFQKELFEIYRQSLETGILYDEKGLLSPWDFKNIITLALRLGELDWTADFIPAQIEHLEPEFRETSLAYNMANLNYHRGQFDQALRLLNQVEFSDIFYSLDTRRMMVKIYFERGDTEALLSLIAAFKIYLKRNKLVSEANRRAYLNFVDLAARIFRAREKGKESLHELSQEVAGTQPLIEESWLLSKTQT
ncbi:MAG: hypothetical protein H6581_07275 [Bacteroidia bacterium]|nr:hypothetical protein [Bacteroidia bacterium]